MLSIHTDLCPSFPPYDQKCRMPALWEKGSMGGWVPSEPLLEKVSFLLKKGLGVTAAVRVLR